MPMVNDDQDVISLRTHEPDFDYVAQWAADRETAKISLMAFRRTYISGLTVTMISMMTATPALRDQTIAEARLVFLAEIDAAHKSRAGPDDLMMAQRRLVSRPGYTPVYCAKHPDGRDLIAISRERNTYYVSLYFEHQALLHRHKCALRDARRLRLLYALKERGLISPDFAEGTVRAMVGL